MRLRARSGRRRAISSVLGAVLFFAILFTAGFGYFVSVEHDVQTAQNSATQTRSQQFIVTGIQTKQGDLGVFVNNTGPVEILVEAVIVSTDTHQVLAAITPQKPSGSPLPLAVDSGQSSPVINTGLVPTLSQPGSYVIEVITSDGATAVALYPAALSPLLSRLSGVTQGLGSIFIDFNSFKFYYDQQYAFGDGFQVNGYYGFEIPNGMDSIFQGTFTNLDPLRRNITITEQSALYLGASGGGGPGAEAFYIVGNLVNVAGCTAGGGPGPNIPGPSPNLNEQCVAAYAYTKPITIAYGQSVTLNFSAPAPGECVGPLANQACPQANNAVSGDVPVFLLLFGRYSDGTLFGQNIPFVSTYGTSVAICNANPYPLNAKAGQLVTFYFFTGSANQCAPNSAPGHAQPFLNPPQIFWVSPNGVTTDVTVTTSTTSATFEVPSDVPPGYYYVYAYDGVNAAYAEVYVFN
ncbi:MAG: hypothetical protein QW767_05960 [Thermoprotei archaeon]